MIVKDDFTRRAWMYFLSNKSDAGSAFRSFLASVRADGIPSLVDIVRSDNGGEFFGGEFASVCNELLIKQEFTPVFSPLRSDNGGEFFGGGFPSVCNELFDQARVHSGFHSAM